MGATLFWLIFGALGIWVQYLVPGLDALAPGLVVSLQREHWSRTFWLAVAFLLVQEGSGSLAFGGAILLYGLLFAGFVLGCRLFETANPLFMLILGLWYGLVLLLGQYILAGLQDVILPLRPQLALFATQSLYFISAWFVTQHLYARKVARHARSL